MSTPIEMPLSSDAVQAADEEIYARHANDPRPNALYDAEGNRLPLDADDPAQEALREEWRQLYAAALAGEEAPSDPDEGGTGPEPPSPPEGNRPIDDPVEPCPYAFWLDVTLIPRPDQQPRPAWWPREADPYPGEHVATDAPTATHLRALDGNGNVHWDDLPAGAYTVEFWQFFSEIDAYLFKEIGA